ncbi:hypothetical protein COCSUDRAFT_61516 [Coccomyxa subellipsoidea C-169]|uniref:Uncharacterized protein n=1 Tax=Coccomyxa subellipsoidea (strain C-169) TaxID=574566 RepID=I0Z3R9_COCSC|nr:hypothetical protein COCSUDRAFT_61516 [Coccomyxa subellipsoidea C-169]EIE25288.1 hypothetical protein COCSUDRAFT_61516 [Coccomyxa subellipsoidea C-169]|eukprot:XP_005649832.1 hypothetical protein COCSUDRAFT_61516 [Coccomyxa subellipsoidea C-169]
MGRGFFPFPPEEVTWDLSENKRKEIVELGLPDDGYDYLQHLKDPAANVSSSDNASAPAAEGPRVFLPAPFVEPPPEDVKYVDARTLPQQTATADVDILQVLGGVAPFARDLDEQPSNRANDVDALNEIMRELENADDDADDGGSGDLLDDFVSTAAAQVTSSNLSTARGSGHGALSFIEEEEELSGQSEGSQGTDDDELESRLGRGYVGSIASTYWRPERTDRGGLATLDERFEQLALEYDSDELGELDDIEGGGAGLEVFGSLLEKSMGEQASRVPVIDGAHPAQGPTHAAKALDRHDDDARIAVEKETLAQNICRRRDSGASAGS